MIVSLSIKAAMPSVLSDEKGSSLDGGDLSYSSLLITGSPAQYTR